MIENKLVTRKVDVELIDERGHKWYHVTANFQVLRKNTESDEPDIWITFTGVGVKENLRDAMATAISEARDLYTEHMIGDKDGGE